MRRGSVAETFKSGDEHLECTVGHEGGEEDLGTGVEKKKLAEVGSQT